MKHFSYRFSFGHSPLLLAAMLLVCASCSKSDDYVYVDDTVDYSGKVTTRVTDSNGNESTLSAGSELGVYATNSSGDVTLHTVKVAKDGSIVLPVSAKTESLVAYLPYQEEWDESAMQETVQFTVKENQSTLSGYNASDLMIGVNTPDDAESGLLFTHVLAQVVINIVDATGTNDFYNCSVSLYNVKNTVNVDLSKQSVSTVEEMKGNIIMLPTVVSDFRLTVKAIVAPQQIESGERFIIFTNNGYSSRYSIPQVADLQGGKTYTINMRLTSTGLEFAGSSIYDWEEGSEVEISN